MFDCDGDGRPDVYLAGGEQPAALFRNDEPDRRRRCASRASPAPELDARRGVTGAYPLDVDGDGITDLAVLAGRPDRSCCRGLGDCRFEPRGRGLGRRRRRPAWTTAFSATWEGDATLPTLAFGSYLDAGRRTARSTPACADNELVPAGRRRGPRTRAPVALSPGYCTLSMLFSDWDGSGRRDLRVTQRPPVLRRRAAASSCGGSRPARRRALYTAGRRLGALQIWGMGIASQDLTGDGLPEVYLTSQGDNKLQTLARRAGAADLPRHRASQRGVDGAPSRTPAATRCRRPPGTRSSQDVNNDGFMDLFVSKGNVDADARLRAAATRATCSSASRTASFVEGAEAAGIVSFDRGRGAALADLNLDGLLDLVRGQPRRAGARLAQRRRRDGRRAGARWATGSRSGCASPAATATRSGRWSRRRSGDAVHRRGASSSSAAATSAASSAGRMWASGPRPRREVRVTWPDGEPGPWLDVAADRFVDIARGAAAAVPVDAARRREGGRTMTRRPRLATVDLPDFGAPGPRPSSPPARYAERVAALRARADARGYDRLVVYADREHSANLSFLTGFDPRFEEAHAGRRAGRPAARSSWATSAAGRPAPRRSPMRRERFQDFSLPQQPRDRSRPLRDDPGGGGDRAGQRGSGSSAGSRSRTGRGSRSRRSSSTSCARLVGPAGARRERERPPDRPAPTACGSSTTSTSSPRSSTPSSRTSDGVRRLLAGLRPGMTEAEAVRLLGWDGTPLSCHLMLTAGPRARFGLLSPADRPIGRGDPFTTAFGIWGALNCRAGWVAEDAGRAAGRRRATTSTASSRRTSRRSPSGTRRSTSGRPAARSRRSSTGAWATRSSASASTRATSSTSTSG